MRENRVRGVSGDGRKDEGRDEENKNNTRRRRNALKVRNYHRIKLKFSEYNGVLLVDFLSDKRPLPIVHCNLCLKNRK